MDSMTNRKVICRRCGTVNLLDMNLISEASEWIDAKLPENFSWRRPIRRHFRGREETLYETVYGEKLTYLEYVRKFDIDPEIAFNIYYMSRWYPTHLKKGVV